MPLGLMPVGGPQALDQNPSRAGLPEICGRHNVNASTRDNTEQNTKDSHAASVYKLKFLTSSGIELAPPRRVGRQGLYGPLHGDEQSKFYKE